MSSLDTLCYVNDFITDVLQDSLAGLDLADDRLLGLIQHAQSLFQTIADLDHRHPNDIVSLQHTVLEAKSILTWHLLAVCSFLSSMQLPATL